jgi:transcriptional regulator with XRE-family HTH domain
MIKNNLHKYRMWKNISQNDLAIKLKIGIIQLRQIEIFHKYPKYQIRSRICEFFGISQNQMFYKDGKEEST